MFDFVFCVINMFPNTLENDDPNDSYKTSLTSSLLEYAIRSPFSLVLLSPSPALVLVPITMRDWVLVVSTEDEVIDPKSSHTSRLKDLDD